MGESMIGLKRTHKCGEITLNELEREVTVMGWVQKTRNLGGVIFIGLRDISGLLQIVFRTGIDGDLYAKAAEVRNEYVIAVKGVVAKRSPEAINPKMPTGSVEIVATEMRILSAAETPPMYIEENSDVNEVVRLKYRYIDLRRPDMQRNIILRHKTAQAVRRFLDENNFLEIETPMLTKSTPEGARDYLVPSRVHPGKYFALPQSPQLFKQLLMVSGFDRYFQIVRCFRDEDLRADRQPEFTQIDIEMSFVNVEDVIEINEKLIKRVFGEILNIKINTPLPRLTYKEAMERFGVDKPDIRFGLELKDISDIVADCDFKVFSEPVRNGGSVRAINATGCGEKFGRREIDGLVELVKTYGAKGMAWGTVSEQNEFKSSIAKYLTPAQTEKIIARMGAKAGDLLCFIADKNEIVFDALGHLRLEIAAKMNLIEKGTFSLLWVTEFPLLEFSEEEGRWVAKHHPFTSPMDEDLEKLETDPGSVRAKAYDIIVNGTELGGGSIRIYDQQLQSKMFSLLGFTKEQAWSRFGFLLEAFRYGTPPHGGIAYGFDRMIMLMAGKESIRDFIAFPKVQNSSDLMSGSPDEVDEKQLTELHIKNI